MKNLFSEFEKKYKDLLEYNAAIGFLLSITSAKDNTVTQRFINANGRVFHYELVIVNLYGIIEWFTENLIKSYLDSICNLVEDYSSLPQCICSNHTSLSADLLKNRERMPRYQHLRTEDIVKNLYDCLYNNKGFKINTEAYTYHSSNFVIDLLSCHQTALIGCL